MTRKMMMIKKTLLLVLMMTFGTNVSWGQTDYSGTYYIRSGSSNMSPSGDYYLCPTVDWAFFYTIDNVNSTDNGQPFLTTHKMDNGDEARYKWIIEKHTEGDHDYYAFKYSINYEYESSSYSRYLSYNRKLTGAGTDRLRIHLEKTENPGDYELFDITPYSTYLVISPKKKDEDENNTKKYLTVNGGNTNYFEGYYTSGGGVQNKDGGPNGFTITTGIIGTYKTISDANAPFYLEDYIKRPEISYSSGNDVTITYPTSQTIYYTTDGSDPTDSENTNRTSFTGTSQTVSFTNVAVVKAAAYIGGEYSNVATYVYVHTDSGNPYLLQSVDNTNFYMVAGDNNNNSKPTVNTSSSPQPSMSWNFENAGIVNGVQCYYVKNTSATGYLRRDGNNFYIETTKADNNDYKFAVIPYLNNSGILAGFYLYNIGKAQYVYKGNNGSVVGNGSNGAVNLNNLTAIDNQDLARWNLILVVNKNFPSIVTLSDNTSATYYTLTSSNATSYLIVPPFGTAVNVTTSTGVSDSQKWFFKDAGSDDWASFYYILNAVTGEAMYFNGTESTSNQENAIKMGELPETPTDAYKFTLAKTITDGECYVIPKQLAQFAKTNYTALWREDENALQTRQDRASDKMKWQINEVENFVLSPVITYEVGENNTVISMSCATPGATIKYSTDGADPTTSGSPYDSSDKPEYGNSVPMYIKAVAVLNADVHSDVITFVRNPKVTFDPTYNLAWDNTAKVPPVSSVTIGTNTTIDESEYSLGYSNNVNVGTATVTISDNKVNNLFISGTTTFEITPRLIGDGAAAAPGFSITIAKSGENYPVTVKDGDTPLTLNTHYTVSKDDEKSNSDMYVAMVTGHGNYGGSAEVVYANVSFPTETSTTDGGSAAAYKATTDLTTPAGLKAYIVTGVNLAEGIVETKEVDYIPEGVPILLLTDNDDPHAADFTTTLISGITSEKREEDTDGNKLQRQETDGTTNVGWGEYYFFTKGEFVLTMGGKIMKAGKFFLENDEYVSGGTPTPAPAMLRIVRGSSTNTTKKDEIIDNSQLSTSSSQLSDEFYTLDGQKLSKKPTRKGIYIQNGKKLIVK